MCNFLLYYFERREIAYTIVGSCRSAIGSAVARGRQRERKVHISVMMLVRRIWDVRSGVYGDGEPTGGKRLLAHMRQGQRHGTLFCLRQAGAKQGAAARQENGKGCGVIIRLPAVECIPVDGLEGRIRQPQWRRLDYRQVIRCKRDFRLRRTVSRSGWKAE
jgi:hypothetical protein